MRTVALFAAACICVLLLSSCAGKDTVGYEFTPADYGTSQTLQVGQVVVVALPSNPSTGYSWHRDWAPTAALTLDREYYLPDQPETTGSGGTQYYVLHAAQAEQAIITVQYGRWGTPDLEDPHTFTLNITP